MHKTMESKERPNIPEEKYCVAILAADPIIMLLFGAGSEKRHFCCTAKLKSRLTINSHRSNLSIFSTALAFMLGSIWKSWNRFYGRLLPENFRPSRYMNSF